jgi:hypothetical protein
VDIELVALVGALGGGAFGTAIGGQPAFIFTGFCVLIGVALVFSGVEYDFLGNVAFGPVFGPHISFAGGVAGACYAARKGYLESGRDIATPVTANGDPMPLVVGAAFGAFGYLFQNFLADVLDANEWTDSVALTVVVSAIIVRLMFGRTGLFGTMTPDARERGRMSISSDSVWVSHQGPWLMTIALGLFAGILSAYFVGSVGDGDPELANSVRTLCFGFSAISLILLQFGQPGPVTHHITLPAAVAAATVMVEGGDFGLALALGALAGVLGALIGELMARVFLIHGDTHLDPPAFAIFPMTSLVLLCQNLFA